LEASMDSSVCIYKLRIGVTWNRKHLVGCHAYHTILLLRSLLLVVMQHRNILFLVLGEHRDARKLVRQISVTR